MTKDINGHTHSQSFIGKTQVDFMWGPTGNYLILRIEESVVLTAEQDSPLYAFLYNYFSLAFPKLCEDIPGPKL